MEKVKMDKESIKGIILFVIILLGIIFLVLEFIGVGIIDSIRYRHRNRIENAIVETFPEGMEVRAFSIGSARTYGFDVVLSPEYFSIYDVGYVIEQISNAVLETVVERRMYNFGVLRISFVERTDEWANAVRWSMFNVRTWGDSGYQLGVTYIVGNLGIALRYEHFYRYDVQAMIPATEVQRVIDAVYNAPELIAYISENLYEVFPEHSHISVRPMWHGDWRPYPRMGGYQAWDLNRMSIEVRIDPELIPLCDFEEYVRNGTEKIYSFLEELNFSPDSLEFYRWGGAEDEPSVWWYPESGGQYGRLHVISEGSYDISIDELQSIINQYR